MLLIVPVPKRSLQRFKKPWKRRGWDSHRDSMSLKTILEKSTGSRLSLPLTPVKSTSTAAVEGLSAWLLLGRHREMARELGGLTRGGVVFNALQASPENIQAVREPSFVVQTNFPQKLHPHGTVWKMELFGCGEGCLFGKR